MAEKDKKSLDLKKKKVKDLSPKQLNEVAGGNTNPYIQKYTNCSACCWG